MSDDLVIHFKDIVWGAYERYRSIRDGSSTGRNRHLSSALELATALFHFREHLPASIQRSRSDIEALCPDYKLIADVTNVAKHAKLNRRTPSGQPLVNVASDVTEYLVVTRFSDNDGEYENTHTAIRVSCTDGVDRSLDDSLISVLNFWINHLHVNGIVSISPVTKPDDPIANLVPRSEARMHSFEALQGMPSRYAMQFRQYDASKGKSVPIDLTGASPEMHIWAPVEMTVSFDHPSLERRGEASLSLSAEDSNSYWKLQSEEEKSDFLAEIASRYSDEIVTAISKAIERIESS